MFAISVNSAGVGILLDTTKGGIPDPSGGDTENTLKAFQIHVERIVAERYDIPLWKPLPPEDPWSSNTDMRYAECWVCQTKVYAEMDQGQLQSMDNYGSEHMPACWLCDEEVRYLAAEAIDEFKESAK